MVCYEEFLLWSGLFDSSRSEIVQEAIEKKNPKVQKEITVKIKDNEAQRSK